MEYTLEKGYVIRDGVKLSYAELIDLLNKLQKVADKWDKLDEEIGEFYNESTYDEENDCDFDESEGDLCSIGEVAAIAFNYL